MSSELDDRTILMKRTKETFDEFDKLNVKKFKKGDLQELFNLMEMQVHIMLINETNQKLLKKDPGLRKEMMKYFYAQVIRSLITERPDFTSPYNQVELINTMKEAFKDSKDSLDCINELNLDTIEISDIYTVTSLQNALKKQAKEEVSEENLDFLLALDHSKKYGKDNIAVLKKIYEEYIKEGVAHQINLSAERRLPLDNIFKDQTPKNDKTGIERAFYAFNAAKAEIENLLSRDTFRRLQNNSRNWDKKLFLREKCQKYIDQNYMSDKEKVADRKKHREDVPKAAASKEEERKVKMESLTRLSSAKSKQELLEKSKPESAVTWGLLTKIIKWKQHVSKDHKKKPKPTTPRKP